MWYLTFRRRTLNGSKVSTIEFSLIEVSVLHGLKQGNDVLKEIHKEMNIESVEKLLDESYEAQAYQRVRFPLQIIVLVLNPILSQQIDEMLSSQLTLDDEDAVQEELKSLQNEAVSSQNYCFGVVLLFNYTSLAHLSRNP